MIPAIKWFALISYWAFLTRSLLMTCPWELISDSLAKSPPLDLSLEPISWLAHLSAYTVLGLLIREASAHKTKITFGLFTLAFIHSISCELLQHLIPNRWPNAWDAVSNTLGLVLAYAIHKTLRPRSQPSLKALGSLKKPFDGIQSRPSS